MGFHQQAGLDQPERDLYLDPARPTRVGQGPPGKARPQSDAKPPVALSPIAKAVFMAQPYSGEGF
jgi:hypothetical protein